MPSIHYSPLTATAVGPAGPPSKLSVGPYSGPSTALLVTASSVVSENDFQWVQLGLHGVGRIHHQGSGCML
jgi:hypothetical protein